MIKEFSAVERFPVKGKFLAGAKAIKAKCPVCRDDGTQKNKVVIAIKVGDIFRCPTCNSVTFAIQGEREFMQALPYFAVPESIAAKVGEKPKDLQVVPAYRNIDKTFPNSYAKFIKGKRHPVCSGDGETANQFDFSKKQFSSVKCEGRDCVSFKNKQCKMSGTLFVVFPDVDMFSAYTLTTHSPQSITNIISALKKLMGADGLIARVECRLTLVEKNRKETDTAYHVLDLVLPEVGIKQLQGFRSAGSMIGYDDQMAQQEGTVVNISAEEPASERVINGRRKVLEKLKQCIDVPNAEAALREYVTANFDKSFEKLAVEELLKLWHGIGQGSEIAMEVAIIAEKCDVCREGAETNVN